MFGLCKGEMSKDDMDIVGAIITDPGGVSRQPGVAVL
jgi:hypothetical protein